MFTMKTRYNGWRHCAQRIEVVPQFTSDHKLVNVGLIFALGFPSTCCVHVWSELLSITGLNFSLMLQRHRPIN